MALIGAGYARAVVVRGFLDQSIRSSASAQRSSKTAPRSSWRTSIPAVAWSVPQRAWILRLCAWWPPPHRNRGQRPRHRHHRSLCQASKSAGWFDHAFRCGRARPVAECNRGFGQQSRDSTRNSKPPKLWPGFSFTA